MRLPQDGQEYIRIPITNYPTGATVEASLDRTTWHPVTVDANGDGLFLVRGPGSPKTDGTIVSQGGDVWIRVDGSPEQVVRKVGFIALY